MKNKMYSISKRQVELIITSLTCTLMSKLSINDREDISSLVNYLLKGGLESETIKEKTKS